MEIMRETRKKGKNDWMDWMDWMNGWDGWMDGWMDGCSLKFLFRGCTCPQGPFFAKKGIS